MPEIRNATQKLRDAGVEALQVVQVGGSVVLFDPRLGKQDAPKHRTWQEAVKAAIESGERPQRAKRNGGGS